MVLVCNLGKKINQPFSYSVKKVSDGCSLDADSFVELVPKYLYKVPLLFCIQSIKIIHRDYREKHAQLFLIRESSELLMVKGLRDVSMVLAAQTASRLCRTALEGTANVLVKFLFENAVTSIATRSTQITAVGQD